MRDHEFWLIVSCGPPVFLDQSVHMVRGCLPELLIIEYKIPIIVLHGQEKFCIPAEHEYTDSTERVFVILDFFHIWCTCTRKWKFDKTVHELIRDTLPSYGQMLLQLHPQPRVQTQRNSLIKGM